MKLWDHRRPLACKCRSVLLLPHDEMAGSLMRTCVKSRMASREDGRVSSKLRNNHIPGPHHSLAATDKSNPRERNLSSAVTLARSVHLGTVGREIRPRVYAQPALHPEHSGVVHGRSRTTWARDEHCVWLNKLSVSGSGVVETADVENKLEGRYTTSNIV